MATSVDFAQPAPQGDFTRAAFTTFRDENYEIYVARGDGTQSVNITNNPAWDVDPQLSPDGAQVVFVSDRDHPTTSPTQARIYNIYVSNVDGSNVRRLTTGRDTQSRPAWSPDGSRILFAMKRSSNVDVYSIRNDGTDLKRLTTSTLADFDPIYTPDGSHIIWTRQTGNNAAYLMRANADGSAAQMYTDPWFYLQRPLFSPTGHLLGYEADANDDGWLDVLFIDPEKPKELPVLAVWGETLIDRTLAGWSPALERNGPDGQKAITDRSAFITEWLYEPNLEEQVYDLVSITTKGFRSWADGRVMDSSPLDMDFHAVSLDVEQPTATLRAPTLVRADSEGLDYRLDDTGGSGIAYIQWNTKDPTVALGNVGINDIKPATDGPGQQLAFWDPGRPMTITVRGWDLAGNAGVWSDPIVTTLYEEGVACAVTDARGVPMPGSTLNFIAAEPFLSLPADALGIARAWFSFPLFYWSMGAEHPLFGATVFPSWLPWASDGQEPAQQILDRCGGYLFDGDRNTLRYNYPGETPTDGDWRLGCGVRVTDINPQDNSLLWMGDVESAPCVENGTPMIVTQAISATATAGLHKPTLSFMYRMTALREGLRPGPAGPVWPLRVLIIEEVPAAPELLATGTLSTTPALTITQVFTQATVPNEPALGWVDLSAWAGRDITVTFELYPDPERQGVSVLLDVISLTPWETPVVYGAALAAEAPTQAQNATATLVITGENFITTPTVSLVTDITTTVPLTLAAPAAETELRVVWPSGHTPGIYRVRVTNPGGIYNEFAFAINLAEVNFLPIAVK